MSHTDRGICTQKDTQTYELSFVHKKHNELVRPNRLFGIVATLTVKVITGGVWCTGLTVCLCRSLRPDGVPTHYRLNSWQWLTSLPPAVLYHHPSLSSSSSLSCFEVSWWWEDVVGSIIQKFTSRDLSKVGCMFSKKKSSSRRFFYVDMRKLRSLPPENLKIWISNTVHSEK
jgi:hypothetical protein